MAAYKPGLPEPNSNVSHESPFKEFATLLAGVLGAVFLVYLVLGATIDYAADKLSYEHEAALFNKIPFQLGEIVGDSPKPNTKLQALVDELRQCSTLPVHITAYSVTTKEPNAMALPGGDMVVFDGLLDHVQSENGLAFVLAHELGHFINRDHLKGMGRGIVLASLSSLLTGPSSSLSKLLTPSFELSTAQFSQKRESAADQTALEILNCYYGHVSGATEFFEALKREETSRGGFGHYFSTHPENEERIQKIKMWQQNRQVPAGNTKAW